MYGKEIKREIEDLLALTDVYFLLSFQRDGTAAMKRMT